MDTSACSAMGSSSTETPVTTGDGSPGFTPAALLVALLALAALAAQTLRS